MTSSQYFRYPHIHEDLVTFVAEDDVWVAPLAGGRAWRVSSLQQPARNPRFTPDGTSLVWTVQLGGAPEVVSAPVAGGDMVRLTHWGHASTKVKGFTPAGDVVVTSSHEQAEGRHTWAYAVALDGSRSERLPYGPVDAVAHGPVVGDERPVVVSSVLSREPAWWKRYRGGTAGKLWIDVDGGGEFVRLAPTLDGNLADPLWVGGRIAFLSDHEGHGNLYSVAPNGGSLQRHTDHEGFYVRHASTDGTRVVFESAGHLFVLDSLSAEPVRLDITLGSASVARRAQPLDVAAHLGDVVPDETGRASAVETHGTVHWLTHRDGPARVLEATPGVRARLVRPLAGDRAIYVADHDGVEALYIKDLAAPGEDAAAAAPTAARAAAAPAKDDDGEAAALPRPVSAAAVNATVPAPVVANAAAQAGAAPAGTVQAAPAGAKAGVGAQPGGAGNAAPNGASDGAGAASGAPAQRGSRRIEFGEPTRVCELVPSPDGLFAAIGTEFGQVLLLDIAAGTLREVARTGVDAVAELVFSPDSRWLLWAEPVTSEDGRSKLRMAPVPEKGAVIDLTDGRFRDFCPDFTPDGRFVAFLSHRSFDPVYDTHSFDLSFPQSTKPFLIALGALTPSPFGPSVAGRAAGTEAASTVPATAVEVDAEGIAGRIIAVPVPQGAYRALRAVEGALLWMEDGAEGVMGDGRASTAAAPAASRLVRFEFAGAKTTVLVEQLDSYRVSGDRKRLVSIRQGKVRAVPTAAAAEADSADSVEVDLERIRVQLDPVKVWGQAFEEAWRLQRDFYWTADMAGTDWQEVYDRYRPLVERLGSHDDLVDLLWEVHGELGTSHAYVSPRPAGSGAGQGRLGADLQRTAGGAVVTRILPGESSDPQAVSPLQAAGVGLKAGDEILEVNGMDVAGAGIDALLAGTAGKVVELAVRTPASGGGAAVVRRVAVVPLADEARLRYQDWVAANRAIVRQASGGSFGYLHIPDMQAHGWAQLHRDLDTETAADGLVVDVRRNRGGHTSQLVAERLARRMDAWGLARGQTPQIYPAQAPRGPVVVLTDEFAGSDGDIITQVAKLRGIGPVVGMRTWGGVVGIDGKFTLADGTGVTQPRYAFWFRGGNGFNVENYGVDPDIEVPYPPHDYMNGNDPQLESAVGVLKEMLKEIPTERPPELVGYRKLKPAKLGPRPKA
ncbi:S41 family peptidase [Arthrobacter sp. 35W]|uniref:S41 family peptidase n=1 Tax=Arthrobacter sp. 35W TaxID=1132441 RepID=UPI00041DDAD2|nr:S41 family peptidase [Arthrobacter sp. 35W]